MKQKTNTTLFFSILLCLVFVLIGTLKHNSALRSEAENSKMELERLTRQVRELDAEIKKTEIDKALSDEFQHDDFYHPVPIISGDSEISEAVSSSDVDEHFLEEVNQDAGMSNNDAIADIDEPEQESTGLREGKIELANLNYDLVIEKFESVDASVADHLDARLGVANAYFYSHRYEDAVLSYQSVLDSYSDSVEAAIGLANSYYRLEQRAEQIAAYDKVIKIEPGQWLHYNSRATAHLMDGNNRLATLDFQRAAHLASPIKTSQATALENIGLIHIQQGHWSLAYIHANEVNKLDTEHAWNWLIRGIAAAKLEQNVDAYVSFDKWFKYKKATDPYLLKQLLPESVHAYIDVTPKGLAKLVDPPKISGERCYNDSQCKSYACKPGPPLNKFSYCVKEDKVCSAPDSNGYLQGELLEMEGMNVRCYQPQSGNARWTMDRR
jgi:tetratricopeptide (TPR) repeat protein